MRRKLSLVPNASKKDRRKLQAQLTPKGTPQSKGRCRNKNPQNSFEDKNASLPTPFLPRQMHQISFLLAVRIFRSRSNTTFPTVPSILRPNPTTNPLRITALTNLRLGDPFVLWFRQDMLSSQGTGPTDAELSGWLMRERHGFGQHEQEIQGQACRHGRRDTFFASLEI